MKRFLTIFLLFNMLVAKSQAQTKTHPTLNVDSNSYCTELYRSGHSLMQGGGYDKAYDTLRLFVSHCTDISHDPDTWRVFPEITGSVQAKGEDKSRWDSYREWLKSVLYLSESDYYYCSDVSAILSTFQYFAGRGYDVNGLLAVSKYLIGSNRCPDLTQQLMKSWGPSRADQYHVWADSVTVDTNIYKVDTTLPSLDDLGLGILRGKAKVNSPVIGLHPHVLLDATADRNPFTANTAILVHTSSTTLIRVALYDMLGREVQTNGIGRVIEAGRHAIAIDGTKLDPGNYYARVSTSDNEVLTVKLSHIK